MWKKFKNLVIQILRNDYLYIDYSEYGYQIRSNGHSTFVYVTDEKKYTEYTEKLKRQLIRPTK